MPKLVDSVDDYIWGKIDEAEYLRKVIEDKSLDADALHSKVQTIQEQLNTQLRKGVEEDYPRLLEQVGAIESLDNIQTHFDKEMQTVARNAEQLGSTFSSYVDSFREDVVAIENLSRLNRLLTDGLRCEALVKKWEQEKLLLRQAEIVHELNAIVKENESMKRVKWMNDSFLFKLPDIISQTRSKVVGELKSALQTLNSSTVVQCLKALSELLPESARKKEMDEILDGVVSEIDAMFLQLGTQPNADKASKLLPQLGNRLNSCLEQFQLLVGKVIAHRVPANAPYAMKLVQTVMKCLATHSESVARPIRDALAPLKAAILSQSLATLFELVDETFAQDEKKGAVIVEKLSSAMKAEFASVSWDTELQSSLEGNLLKTLKYIGVKVEQQLQINEETLRLSGRVSRTQAANYQMLSVAYAFTKLWPSLSEPLRAVIEPNVSTIVETMKNTLSLVFASMHDEDLYSALGSSSSSLYMKELCDHLKVFRTHVAQLQPLSESLEALPNFINFVIEQYLLHISLVRPVTQESNSRFIKDLEYLVRVGLQ
ncbi:COG5 protein, partial [Aphelenchoides avenae]